MSIAILAREIKNQPVRDILDKAGIPHTEDAWGAAKVSIQYRLQLVEAGFVHMTYCCNSQGDPYIYVDRGGQYVHPDTIEGDAWRKFARPTEG